VVFLRKNQPVAVRKPEIVAGIGLRATCGGEMAIRLARQETDYKNIQEKLSAQSLNWRICRKNSPPISKNIANKILRENSKEFTFLNQKNMGDILTPLKEKSRNLNGKLMKHTRKAWWIKPSCLEQ